MSERFVDWVRIHVAAGDGGHGCISFHREKGEPRGGPDGGDGGRGGSIWLEGAQDMVTLLDLKLRPTIRGTRGRHGEGSNCSGRSGQDITIRVPLGTQVSDPDSGESLGDLTTVGQKLLVARGGDGGMGNQHFATSTNHAPRKAQDGWPGRIRNLVLELKVIADAGVVGLPNAGKSTLLSALTDANPKIAPYPFTTIHPNLGVFLSRDGARRITLADIPGLIEGAHKGAGLGDRFLRHIERTKTLVHLVSPDAGQDEEGNPTEADVNPESLLYAYDLVSRELEAYSRLLADKPRIACLNKIDLLTPEQSAAIVAAFAARGIALRPISASHREGMEQIRDLIEAQVLVAEPDPVEAVAIAPQAVERRITQPHKERG